MTRRGWLLAAFAWLTLSAASAPRAGEVVWQLAGTIDHTNPDPAAQGGFPGPVQLQLVPELEALGLTAGSPWSAQLRYDASAPGVPETNGNPIVDFAALVQIEFAAGGFAAAAGPGTGTASTLFFGAANGGNALVFDAPASSSSPDLVADSARLVLASLLDSAFPSDTLPAAPPDLDDLVPASAFGGRGSLVGTHFALLGHGSVPNDPLLVALYGAPAFVDVGFSIEARISSMELVPEARAVGVTALAALALVLALRRTAEAASARAPPRRRGRTATCSSVSRRDVAKQ